MFSIATRTAVATALAGAALASAVGVASADQGYQDLRSPDAVDAARQAGEVPEVPPSPSSIAASAAEEYQDLRSPDTRDQAEGYSPTLESRPVVDESPSDGGFDLLSAALGAAAGAGLLIVLMAMSSGVARRRSFPRARPQG